MTEPKGDRFKDVKLGIHCAKCGHPIFRTTTPYRKIDDDYYHSWCFEGEKKMKVLICGDRNWTDRELVLSWLSKLQDWGYTEVIEGEARGADRISRELAEKIEMTVLKFPAEWDKYGRSAGPIRNRQMLDECPDLVLAFHDNLDRSKGTADTVHEAKRQGIRCIVVSHEKGGEC